MSLRLVMMGTGPFAAPTFKALLDSPHPVAALVTRPDRPIHDRHKRKQAAPLNPMREGARQRGIEVFEPQSINAPEAQERLGHWAADLFVVCDYGQILSRETLALARLGGINLHASLLPKYRGAAPIQWAIFHGETETGVSVIHMTPQLDAGPVLLQPRLAIEPDETAAQLEPRLAALGPSAVLGAIDRLAAGDTSGISQDPTLATKAPRLKKTDGLVDWRRSAEEIRDQVRAMEPWPKTYTFWRPPAGQPLRLILESVAARSESHSASPGTVIAADASNLLIGCGDGSLAIDRLQPAGKRSMSASEFLRGHPVQPGHDFGDEAA
ncbi:MAG TPA: methionyl-tRNA formyltransferase [Pirellulales bacterium]|nr:methionyl-tRNA formyltransferase [Pirellulales bacterium]